MEEYEENIYDILESHGFELELFESMRANILHPKTNEPMAIIEDDGSITIAKEFAYSFDHLLPINGVIGRFQYQWQGATRLSKQEIVNKLLSVVK